MVVVTDHGYEPVFFGEIVDEFERRLRAVAPVQEVPEVNQGIDRAKALGK